VLRRLMEDEHAQQQLAHNVHRLLTHAQPAYNDDDGGGQDSGSGDGGAGAGPGSHAGFPPGESALSTGGDSHDELLADIDWARVLAGVARPPHDSSARGSTAAPDEQGHASPDGDGSVWKRVRREEGAPAQEPAEAAAVPVSAARLLAFLDAVHAQP
jgi:hypothetical protein